MLEVDNLQPAARGSSPLPALAAFKGVPKDDVMTGYTSECTSWRNASRRPGTLWGKGNAYLKTKQATKFNEAF